MTYRRILLLLGALLTVTGCNAPHPSTDAADVSDASDTVEIATDVADSGPTCPASQTLCGSACATLSSDRAHCGACGHACADGEVCSGGTCTTTCGTGLSNCSGSCRDTRNDPMACGGCITVCPSGAHSTPVCSGGACAITCLAGFADCDGDASNGCEVDLSSDANHCGGCGVVCALAHADSTCLGGACRIGACTPPFADCNGAPLDGCEADTRADHDHCGSCSTTCGPSEVCSSSSCSGSCAAPAVACGSSCRDTQNDPMACGSCTNVCPFGPHATAVCGGGTCALSCAAGYADCNGDATDGCEVDVRTDATHCGGCGVVCSFAHAGATCDSGVCALGTCAGSFADCNGVPTDGCEVDTQADHDHCGACATACGAGEVCATGGCAASCAAPLTVCGSACRDTQNDPMACGSCSTACTSGPNSSAICRAGLCGLACAPGYADCNGDPSDGCEVDVRTDANHCGGCGVVCSFAHAGATCAAGVCTLGACTGSFADCNGVATDGCEADTQADHDHCGGCATACGAGQVCSTGTCAGSCAASLTTCGASCRDTRNDPAACGGCTSTCPSGVHSTAICSGGTCGISCAAGFADCNSDPTDGCEVDLRTTANCGGCGVVCAFANAGATCTSGTCAMGACSGSFADCDGSAINGCERDLRTDHDHCGTCTGACGATERCVAGTCSSVITCPSGQTLCGSACFDLLRDHGHCGSCTTSCSASQACVAGACQSAYPASCREQAQLAGGADGSYTLYLGNRPSRAYPAYCAGMSTSDPRTYLTLPSTGNVAAFRSWSTSYTRVRFDPSTLQIDPNDFTFATGIGAPSPVYWSDPSFGTLRSAAQVPYGSTSSSSNVTLSGLPFYVSVNNWGPELWVTTGSATLTCGGQVVNVTGDGGGWVSTGASEPPTGPIQLAYGSGEICNGTDDNCNGTVDDGCPASIRLEPTVNSPLFWANGPSPFDDPCPAGSVIVGVNGRSGAWSDMMQVSCGALSLVENSSVTPHTFSVSVGPGAPQPTHGDTTGGGPWNAACPAGMVLTRITGSAYNQALGGFGLECGTLSVTGTRAGSYAITATPAYTTVAWMAGFFPGAPFDFRCPDGGVASGAFGTTDPRINDVTSFGIHCASIGIVTR